MKMCPVGAELFHVDGQIDMRKQIVAFRSLAEAPKYYKTARRQHALRQQFQ